MKKDKETKHHIFPKSRIKKHCRKNAPITLVKGDLHNWYHATFGNYLPEEVFDFLNSIFWDNRYEIIERRK